MDEVIELNPAREVAASAPSTALAAGPLSMAIQAMKAGMSVADMRSLLELQKEWEANEARKAYALAMSGFKAEKVDIFKNKAVGYKTKDGDFVGYKHAELSDVTDAITPAMSKHQLSHRWDVKQTPGFIVVSCIITHALGHSESISMTAAPDTSGKKNQIQQIASAVTYLQRYTLLAIAGMSTKGEDDDGRGGASTGDGRGDEQGYSDGRGAADDDISLAGNPQRATPPAAQGFYPDDKFNKNFAAWEAVIQSGKKTPDSMITFLSSKQPLTDAQKSSLRNVH